MDSLINRTIIVVTADMVDEVMVVTTHVVDGAITNKHLRVACQERIACRTLGQAVFLFLQRLTP